MSPKRRNFKYHSKQSPYKGKKIKTTDTVANSFINSATSSTAVLTTPTPKLPTKEVKQECSLRITQSGKIKKYVEQGLKTFQNKTPDETTNIILILSGIGPAVAKTVSIVEIIKRKMNGALYQYNQISRTFVKTRSGSKNVKGESSEDIEDEEIEDHEEKKYGTSGEAISRPTITIYLSTKSIPHLESSVGYKLPTNISS